jgi:hypothetical protein
VLYVRQTVKMKLLRGIVLVLLGLGLGAVVGGGAGLALGYALGDRPSSNGDHWEGIALIFLTYAGAGVGGMAGMVVVVGWLLSRPAAGPSKTGNGEGRPV